MRFSYVLNYLYKILAAVGMLGFIAICSSKLGEYDYGVFEFFMATAGLFQVITRWGFSNHILQITREYLHAKLGGIFYAQLAVVCVLLVCIVVVNAYIPIKDYSIYIEAIFLGYVFALIDTMQSILRACGKVTYWDMTNSVIRPSLLLLGILFCIMSGITITLTNVIGIVFVSAVISFVILLFLGNSALKFSSLSWRYSLKQIAKTLANGMHLFCFGVMITILMRIEHYIIPFLSGYKELAVYALAFRFYMLWEFGSASIDAVVTGYLILSGDKPENIPAVRRAVRQALMISVFGLCLFVLVGKSLIVNINPNLIQSYGLVIILAFATTLVIAFGPNPLFLIVNGQNSILVKITFLSILVSAAISYFLVLNHGAIGGAIGLIIGILFMKLSCYFYVKHKYNVNLTIFGSGA